MGGAAKGMQIAPGQRRARATGEGHGPAFVGHCTGSESIICFTLVKSKAVPVSILLITVLPSLTTEQLRTGRGMTAWPIPLIRSTSLSNSALIHATVSLSGLSSSSIRNAPSSACRRSSAIPRVGARGHTDFSVVSSWRPPPRFARDTVICAFRLRSGKGCCHPSLRTQRGSGTALSRSTTASPSWRLRARCAHSATRFDGNRPGGWLNRLAAPWGGRRSRPSCPPTRTVSLSSSA